MFGADMLTDINSRMFLYNTAAEQHSIALNQRNNNELHIDKNMLYSVSLVF